MSDVGMRLSCRCGRTCTHVHELSFRIFFSMLQAAIAQLGERQTEDLKVPGSIPGLGKKKNEKNDSDVGRLHHPMSHPVNRGVTSTAPFSIAQSAKRMAFNVLVSGSASRWVCVFFYVFHFISTLPYWGLVSFRLRG